MSWSYDLCHIILRHILGLPISPSSRASWDSQLLKIPAVSPSVMNCCVIRVEYYVKVCRILRFIICSQSCDDQNSVQVKHQGVCIYAVVTKGWYEMSTARFGLVNCAKKCSSHLQPGSWKTYGFSERHPGVPPVASKCFFKIMNSTAL